MNETVFTGSVEAYCVAAGAGVGVREHLLANYRVLVGAWKITVLEFGEIAFRLVSEKRIPNWPKEHSEAIGRELDVIRKERIAASRPQKSEHECPVCAGVGLVVVPHPCCVHRGKVTGFYDAKAKVRRRDVVTCTVICTADKCYAGQAVRASNARWADETKKPKMLTMDGYLRRVGQYVEPTVLLREWEHDQAMKARMAQPRDGAENDIFRSLIGNILARQDAWESEPRVEDDAEIPA